MSQIGYIIIFLISFVGAIIVGAYFLSFAAHCFLVILEQTAAGNDEVAWPDDPFLDWLAKVFYLAWLAALWSIPAWLLARFLAPLILDDRLVLPLVMGMVWLIFPLSLLSALSAQSKWVVIHFGFLRRVLYHIPALFLCYLFTAPLLIGTSILSYWAIAGISVWYIFLSPVVAGAALMIYARLVGRVAWLVSYRTPAVSMRSTSKSSLDSGSAKEPSARPEPWRLPDRTAPMDPTPGAFTDTEQQEAGLSLDGKERIDEEEDEWNPRKKPYRVMDDDEVKATAASRRKRSSRAAEQDEGYVLQPEGSSPQPAPASFDDAILSDALPNSPWEDEDSSEDEPHRKRKRKRRGKVRREPGPRPPRFPMLSGVFHFPWYASSFRAWFSLSLFGFLLTILLRIMWINSPL